MNLSLIAAVANNHVIGHENRMAWHMPADLKHFKQLTMNHTLIMGRKTYESIGKPLKGRKTVIVTKNKQYNAPGCLVAGSVEEVLRLVKEEQEVFVAGGAEIYRQTIDLPQTQRMYITRVYADVEGDAFFPRIDPVKWELVDKETHQTDEKNPYPYAFLTYRKNTP